MPSSPNKLSQFWQELKRRNVVRVITVYTGAAFVILSLVDMVREPFELPNWSFKLVVVILFIGLIIAVILSWIYDIHPEGGRVKTEPADKVKPDDIPKSSKGWKIASYISFVVIVGLIVWNVIPRSGKNVMLEKSIAVLPFESLSDDPEKRYQADGVMDAILLHLSKIEDLRVISRTSVEQYRGTDKTVNQICDELDVAYLLEGSFRRYGDQARLIVQLIQPGREGHVWANNYDRDWVDIFSVESEVAKAVAGELQAVITPEVRQRIEKPPTSSLTAYDFYQQAELELINRNIDRAEELFRKALKIDPMYADVYVGLAEIYWRKNYWPTIFEEDFMDSALILANKALSIDSRLSDAFVIRGHYYWNIDEIDRAIKEFDRAIELNPNNGWAYVSGGSIYSQIDLVKSIQYYHKALALNRGDQLPRMLDNVGWAYLPTGFIDKSRFYYTEALLLTKDSAHYYDRLRICEFVNEDFPLALEYLKKAYSLDSTNNNIHSSFGEYYMLNGDYVQSLQHFKKWLRMTDFTGQNAVYAMHRVGWAYWKNGYKEEGEEFLLKQIDYCDSILDMGRVIGATYRNYYDLAASYAFIGEKDKAFSSLRSFKDYLTGDRWGVMYFNNDPLFDPIRNEPEFQQIVRDVEAKYQAEHERVRQWLEENDML